MSQQSDWRFCQKCQVMFYDGFPNKGVCEVGGGHLAQGFNFDLPYDMQETPQAQVNWRFCSKCSAIYYDGSADKGHCPAGGAHTAQGYNFTLPHDVAETANAQAAWRFCNNCKAMFYDGFPSKGTCPAHVVPGPRGVVHIGHVAQGFNFVLPHDLPAAEPPAVSITGPVWVVSLTHQQAEAVEGSLGAIAGATTLAGPVGAAIAAAVGGAAGIIQLMDAIGGDQGVDIQGVVGVPGVIVTPHASGMFGALVQGARVGAAVATIVEFILKAGSVVPAIAQGLGVQVAATVFAGIEAGTPLGWALEGAVAGTIIKLLEPAPDPNAHGGVHADRTAAGDWERFILAQLPPGNHIALLSWQGLFSAQNGGGGDVYANRPTVGPWETWTLIHNPDQTVSFQSTGGHFLSALNGGGNGSVCTVKATAIGSTERFFLQNLPGGHISIKTHDKGTFLSVQPGK